MEFDRTKGRNDVQISRNREIASLDYTIHRDGIGSEDSEEFYKDQGVLMEQHKKYPLLIDKAKSVVSTLLDNPIATGLLVGGITLGAQLLHERLSAKNIPQQNSLTRELVAEPQIVQVAQ